MARHAWAAADDQTHDLLALVADPQRPVGREDVAAFLNACEADARAHACQVSVNRVRARIDATAYAIEPRRYSSLWSLFTSTKRGPMVRTVDDAGAPVWEMCAGSHTGNDGRPFPIRTWVGFTDPSDDPRRKP